MLDPGLVVPFNDFLLLFEFFLILIKNMLLKMINIKDVAIIPSHSKILMCSGMATNALKDESMA